MIKRFSKVNNLLYRGGAPSIKDIYFLKKIGVSKIISLDYKSGQRIDRATKILGIKHIMIPIEFGKLKSLLTLLYNIDKLFIDNEITFIHCMEGKDRTGLVIALYRCIYNNWNYKEAINEANSFGFGIGVPPQIIKLYIKIIKSICINNDVNNNDVAYDIVSSQRAAPSDYHDYTLDVFEQQSWSPYADYRVREFPYANTDVTNYTEQYPTREDYGLDDSEILFRHRRPVEVPQIGQLDENTQALSGAGPSYIGSGAV